MLSIDFNILLDVLGLNATYSEILIVSLDGAEEHSIQLELLIAGTVGILMFLNAVDIFGKNCASELKVPSAFA